jgi:uncharacterized protein YsxB (DUF464 family)
MTDIKLFKKDNIFVGFECSGHTGYADYGKDILCATISGITQSVALGLKDVCNIDVNIKRIDKSGYIKVVIPDNLQDDKLNGAQILFETLKIAIEDLVSGYSDYISMEVIEYVY